MTLSETNDPRYINGPNKTAVFQVADAACFLWKNMDDAYIIYDTRSGHSQVLNEFAREIFAIIEDGPCGLKKIIEELENLFEHTLEEDIKQQVYQTVAEFDRMGLIEPINLDHKNDKQSDVSE